MKRTVMIVLLCLLGWCVQGQETKHVMFKYTPLDGTVGEFVGAMERQGLVQERCIGHTAVMKGEFVGRKATFYIAGTNRSAVVWKVRVALPPTDSWTELKNEYSEIKSACTKKYGTPTVAYEFFSRPYGEGGGGEMEALQEGKCTYICAFAAPGGTVWVKMERGGALSINYEDAVNTKLHREETRASIVDEL